MGEHDQRHIVVQLFFQQVDRRLDPIGGRQNFQPMFVAQQFYDTLQHIEIRRKIEIVGEDAGAPWLAAQRRQSQFEQIDRGRIGHQHLLGLGADQASDLGAHPFWQLKPALVPASNQPFPPLLLHHFGGQ